MPPPPSFDFAQDRSNSLPPGKEVLQGVMKLTMNILRWRLFKKYSCSIYFTPQNLWILWGHGVPNQIEDLVG